MASSTALSRVGDVSTSYQAAVACARTRRCDGARLHARRMSRSCSIANTMHFAHTSQPIAPVCSLRKEQKKLAKSLKVHRKRLSKMLKSAEAVTAQAPLAEVYSELKRVHELLEITHQLSLQALARPADSSSSCDSSCSEADEPSTAQRPAGKGVGLRAGFGRVKVNMLTAVTDVEVPAFDDDFTPAAYNIPGRIVVCQGSKCQARGGADLLRAASFLTSASEGIDVLPCKCMGKCGQAPALRVKAQGQDPVLIAAAAPVHLPSILEQQFSSRAAGLP